MARQASVSSRALRSIAALCRWQAFGEQGLFARVVRGAGWTLLSQVLGGLLAVAAQLVLARWLGTAGFGVYVVVLSALAVLTMPATLGLDRATLRFVPEYLDAPGRYRGFIRFATTAALVGGMTAALVSLVLGLALSARGSRYGAGLMAGAPLAAMLPSLAQAAAVARANGRALVAVAPGDLLRPAVLIGAIGSMVWAGTEDSTAKALLVTALAAGVALCVQLYLLLEHRSRLPSRAPVYRPGTWLGLAIPMLSAAGLGAAMSHGNILLVGILLAPPQAGAYVAAIKISTLVAMMLAATNALAAPAFAQLHARGANDELSALVRQCAHLIFWPALLLALMLAIAGPWVLALFGPQFTAAYPALLILIAGQVINAATGSVGHLTQLTGDQRGALITLGCSAVVNLGLSLALIPWLGIIGAAIASATGLAFWNVWLHRRVVRRLGVYPAITDALIHATTKA